MATKHKLNMRCGVQVEMTVDLANGEMLCEWTPEPPFSDKIFPLVLAEYLPWRDKIINKEAARLGVTIAVATIGGTPPTTNIH